MTAAQPLAEDSTLSYYAALNVPQDATTEGIKVCVHWLALWLFRSAAGLLVQAALLLMVGLIPTVCALPAVGIAAASSSQDPSGSPQKTHPTPPRTPRTRSLNNSARRASPSARR